MPSQQPEPRANIWQSLLGVSQQMLQPVRLNPGQTLHDRDQLPPGVLLIEQGDMRLLGLDQRKEAFANHNKALQTTQSIKTSTHQEPTVHSNQDQQKKLDAAYSNEYQQEGNSFIKNDLSLKTRWRKIQT